MTRPNITETFKLAHMTFEITESDRGSTYAVFACTLDNPKKNRLFTGVIEKGMASDLRALARKLAHLEARL